MKLNSKELLLIFIEVIIGIILSLLFSFNNIKFSSIITWILLIVVGLISIVLIFWIIYQRIAEIDKALENQEIKQKEIEEKLKRTEELIDIRADIKELKRRFKKW